MDQNIGVSGHDKNETDIQNTQNQGAERNIHPEVSSEASENDTNSNQVSQIISPNTPTLGQSNVDHQNNTTPRKRPILIILIVLVLISVFAGTGYYVYTNYFSKDKTKPDSTATTNSSVSNNKTNGLVKFDEIGCSGEEKFVVSLTSGKVPIDKNGNYNAQFSTQGPQLVIISNEDTSKQCASAISLPTDQGKVVFNAESTAKSAVFSSFDVGLIGVTDSTVAKQRLDMIGNLTTYPALYSYLKKNLHTSDINALTLGDTTYQQLVQSCINETTSKLNTSNQ